MPVPTAGRLSLHRALQVVLVAALLGFVGWAAVRQWSSVRAVIGELSVTALALSFAAALLGAWCAFLSWRAVLADLGGDVRLTAGMRIFFVGQLGKYVPGKVWPILTQARLGRDYQLPGRSSAAAAAILMGIALLTALAVTAVCLPVVGGIAWREYWWTVLALPAVGVVLWPPVLNRLLAWVMRVARRDPVPRPLSLRGIGLAVWWSLVSWLCYGAHLWVLLGDLRVGGGATLGLLSLGAFAASWSVGFLLAVAPAGVGGREVALVVILGVSVAQPVALVAAVVSRLLMTLADIASPAVALLVERRRLVAGAPR